MFHITETQKMNRRAAAAARKPNGIVKLHALNEEVKAVRAGADAKPRKR